MINRGYSNARLAAVAAGLLILGLSTPLMAADNFQTRLGPSPLDAATKPNIEGSGTATATLEGNKFTVNGSFEGLVTPATDASLRMGIGIGVPGPTVFALTVSAATRGTLGGTFTLTPAQVAAARSGKFYVQINSQKAGDPYGNLWGWLLPAHETVGADVPQEGQWFMPPHGPLLHD